GDGLGAARGIADADDANGDERNRVETKERLRVELRRSVRRRVRLDDGEVQPPRPAGLALPAVRRVLEGEGGLDRASRMLERERVARGCDPRRRLSGHR